MPRSSAGVRRVTRLCGLSLALLIACASPPAYQDLAEPGDPPEVLGLIFGGMAAPKRLYRNFTPFLTDELEVFGAKEGHVLSVFVSSGAHVIRMMVHASRVESGHEVLYSSGTLRRSQAVVEQTIAPFLAARPDGRLVLGGHSYGSIVMQSVKTIVEKRYGPERIVAAYALSPVAHRLDPEVLVLIGDRDWMVPISDLLCRGEAVSGVIVNVPGLDHFAIQNSPDALTALRRYFYERAQPVKRAVDQEDGPTVDHGAW